MKLLALTVSAMVCAVLIAGIIVLGSPSDQRNLQFDSRRVQDLSVLQSEIIAYWQAKHALPQNLQALNDPLVNGAISHDPETGASYQYRVRGDKTFTLCAIFAKNGPAEMEALQQPAPPRYPAGMAGSDSWQHGSGTVCFDRSIDTDFFPPRSVK